MTDTPTGFATLSRRAKQRTAGTTRFILFTPGVASEEYFDGLAQRRASGRQLTQAEFDGFARQHGQISVH